MLNSLFGITNSSASIIDKKVSSLASKFQAIPKIIIKSNTGLTYKDSLKGLLIYSIIEYTDNLKVRNSLQKKVFLKMLFHNQFL